MNPQNKNVIGNKRDRPRRPTPSNKGHAPTSRQPSSGQRRENANARLENTRPPRSLQNQTQRRRGSQNLPPQKRRKKKSFFKKTLIFLLILLIVLSCSAFAMIKFGNLNKDLDTKAAQYSISSNAASMASKHRIVNIAIFGVDGREDVEGNRSDSIMIASADFEHSKIKVTSLMRDTYVYIDKENGYDKLNAAYALGGPSLALKTINKNFDTPITDYVTVDFTAMVAMVNAVGGVSINVESEDELHWINQYLMDVNDKVKTSSPDVAGIGPQIFDGSQALAYCRIRYVGNGDFDRTQRQRKVFEQVLQKGMDLNPLAQYNLLMQTMPYVETSLSMTEILKYAGNTMFMSGHEIIQKQIPAEDYVDTGMLDGISYVFPVTLVDNIKALYQFIYEADYTPSGTAKDISTEIEDVW